LQSHRSKKEKVLRRFGGELCCIFQNKSVVFLGVEKGAQRNVVIESRYRFIYMYSLGVGIYIKLASNEMVLRVGLPPATLSCILVSFLDYYIYPAQFALCIVYYVYSIQAKGKQTIGSVTNNM